MRTRRSAAQGPANVGGAARALQNFGLSDLRIVAPGPYVTLDAAAEADGGADAPDGAACPPPAFVPEAYEYAGAPLLCVFVVRLLTWHCGSERGVGAGRRAPQR